MLTITERRILGSLYGVAIGDAIGAAAVGYWEGLLKERYGGLLTGFVEPIPANPTRTKWDYAEVTDDTVTTFAVARGIVQRGGIVPHRIARGLADVDPRYLKGANSALARVARAGHVSTGGRGNGASIRIAPIGMVSRPPLDDRVIQEVAAVSVVTHRTKAAVGAAAALAAMVSAAVEGHPKDALLSAACAALRRVDALPLPDDGSDLATGIAHALEAGPHVFCKSEERKGEWGFLAEEAMPVVVATIMHSGSVTEAILTAANLGGDADSVASMVGGVVAALDPSGVPREWISQVVQRNPLPFEEYASELARIRGLRSGLGEGG